MQIPPSGLFGDRFPDGHPGLCRGFIARGEAGCSLGAGCRRVHTKLYKSSLKTQTCSRKKCFYYHVKGTIRTNRLPASPASKPVSSTSSSFAQPGSSNLVPTPSLSVPTIPEFSQVVTNQPPPAGQTVATLASQGPFLE